ncbi:MAG: thiamine pyrophosphate-dependent dehydrogenase E1 component subunit alpha [Chloroflexi bacterium]|nr:MAG: thiamine pyrophosphate-dependent dehydrogenase E1 component subunit alpha [Chloroflexota bacterium]
MSTQIERQDDALDLADIADPSTEELRAAYRWMLLARRLDERMWQLIRQGKGHFAVPCWGHEAVSAGYALALRRGYDYVAPHYRDLAAMLAIGLTPRDVLANYFARAADPCSRGRQPYVHWGSHRLRILTLQGPQPNQVTHGVGVAYGDGGAQKGEVHEAMNFAAIHRLPCVFCCENNRYTQSVPLALESSVSTIAVRAAAYGMPGMSIDGMDLLAVYRSVAAAVARARRGEGPSLIEAQVYRYGANTSNDDDSRYRSRAEVEEWRTRDPIPRCRTELLANGILTQTDVETLEAEVAASVDDAVVWVETAPDPAPEDALLYTYAEEV